MISMNMKQKGFSLLETLVAIGILILSLLGPLTLASYSINSAILARNEITVFNLASEALEIVKNKRDENVFQGADWLAGLSYCSSANGCFVDFAVSSPYGYAFGPCSASCPILRRDPISGLFNASSGEESVFARKVIIDNVTSDEAKIRVEITWKEKLASRSFVLETNIFNWH